MNTSAKTNGHIPSSTIAIPLEKIIPSTLAPQEQRRQHFSSDSLGELAASLRAQGQLQAIIVRPHRKKDGHYELVAGERRYRASLLNKAVTIDASVRDLSDDDVVQVQLQENLQRKEVEPLDEAFAYKWLIEHAKITEGSVQRPYTVADIAAKFAKTEEIILRRLKLNDLSEKGRTDLAEGKLPLAHAELVARFPEAEQKELLNRYVYNWHGNPNPIKDVRLQIERSLVRSLAKAPFDVADASLHPGGLVCGNCHERTGFMPGLFEGDLGKNDHCLNGKCFIAKINSTLKAKRSAIALSRPNSNSKHTPERLEKAVPLIRGSYSAATPLGKDGTYLEDRNYDRKFEKAKKADECPNTEAALYVEGDQIGKTIYICRQGGCKIHKVKKQSTSSSRSTVSMTPERKEEQLNAEVYEKVRVAVLKAQINSFNATRTVWGSPELRRELLTALLDVLYFLIEEKAPEGFDKEFIPAPLLKLLNTYNADRAKVHAEIDKLSATEESRIFALAAFSPVGFVDYNQKPNPERMQALAKDLNLNYSLLDAEARLELVPKEHKATMEAYLEAVKSGAAIKPPKIFDVQKVEKKKSAKGKVKAANAGK